MDAIDILGSLLGNQSQGGGSMGTVLKDMLGGGRRPAPREQPRQHPRARKPQTIGEAAQSLEELLGVSHQHHQQQRAPERKPTPQPAPQPQHQQLNDQAAILVRAMVSAAKSDGQITKDEQQRMIRQLGHASPDTIEFLREQFRQPVDIRDLCWRTPRGMEEQVYTVSLIAIDLDEQKEAEYLADLCQGLRMDPARCNEIHQRYGAPVIFQS